MSIKEKRPVRKTSYTPNGEEQVLSKSSGVSMLPPPLQLQKVPSKPKENKKLTGKGLFQSVLGGMDGLHIVKKMNNAMKLADNKSSAMDRTKAGLGMAGNTANLAAMAAEKMNLTGSVNKLKGFAGNIKMGSAMLNMISDPSAQNLVEGTMDISSVLLKKSGNKYLANTIGKAAMPVTLIFNLYDIFDNYFGSYEAARQAKLFKNFRVGFAKGIAANLLNERPKDHLYRTVKSGVSERVSRTVGVAEKGNNQGVSKGYAFAAGLPSGFKKFLLKTASNALKDGGDNEYWLNQYGVTTTTLCRTLLPLVDVVFDQWRADKAKEAKQKKAAERLKWMSKSVHKGFGSMGGGKI